MAERTYDIAKRGLATNFTEVNTPLEYASRFLNRFVNSAGGAEKRQGDVQIPGTLPTGGTVTGVHEYVRSDDTATTYCSADGIVFRYDGSAAWTSMFSFSTAARVRHVQMGDKLIFFNGYDRQKYVTSDALNAQAKELIALVEEGTTGTSTSAAAITDADISNWPVQTQVIVNDLVYNATRGTYGIVTAVTSARVSHSPMSAAAQGFGNTTTPPNGFSGIGGEPVAGDKYQVIDLIELNVVDTTTVPDNLVAITTATTVGNATTFSVSADRVSNWVDSQLRPGDVVYNTTRNAASFVQSMTTASVVLSPAISTMIGGDTVTFHKSAMPIAKWIHVHYGRAYMIDARSPRDILISGANDIQDMTIDSASLNSLTLAIGQQQPGADPAKVISSFQTYLIVGTERAVYAFRGTQPTDLTPAGLFPQGVVSPDAFVNTGNDLAFISPDGLLSVSLLLNTSNLQRSNLSEPIKNDLRELIKNLDEPNIQALNYPRRSWVILKLGSKWYVYNYANFVLEDGRLAAGASWSDFTGDLCNRRVIYLAHNNDILLGGPFGKVYRFDQRTYSDDGAVYTTEYETGWLELTEPKRTVKTKSGSFIEPQYEVGGRAVYTISAVGDFDINSLDSVVVTAADDEGGRPVGISIVGTDTIGGGRTTGMKTPLRWRGQQFRVKFKTEDTTGPDVLAGFTIYGTVHGWR